MSDASDTPSPAATTPPVRPPRDRRNFVITMIAMALLLFIATEGLLYYRWATMIEPTCVLLIETAEPLRGAEVVVDGDYVKHKVIAGDHERFGLPFYLEPGRYKVKLTINGEEFFHTEMELTRDRRGIRLDLKNLVPPGAPPPPTTTPANPIFP